MAFVRCREMFVSLRLLNYYMYGTLIYSIPRGLSVVEGVVQFSECPFWETLLYYKDNKLSRIVDTLVFMILSIN